jgi:HK97 family phage major capsid protein
VDLLKKLQERRDALKAKIEQRLDAIEADETREVKDLTEVEAASHEAELAEVKALNDRIEELAGMYADQSRIDESARKALETPETKEKPKVKVGDEPRTYTRDAERRGGVEFLRDLANARQDPSAGERLARHQREAAANELKGLELRDVGTGAFAGLTVPQYLVDLVAPLRRAGRPTADICNVHPLPPEGMTVNVSRITTGSAAAIQASEGAGATETNMDDTLLTINVRTIAGMQDVSRQAIDRSTGVSDIVVADLMRSYNTTLDGGILNNDGTSGTHLGIRSTSAIVAVTYTDASPTAAELYPKLFDLIQQIQAGVFLGVSHFIMHPRRFWWIASQVGTTFPFLQFFSNAPQVGGSADTLEYENGPSGNIGGVPVIVDGNMLTNLGGGTEDVILGVTASELHLWEEPNAPLFIRTDTAIADLVSVRFVLYGYSAFAAGRYPGAHGTVGGTGLAAPTF